MAQLIVDQAVAGCEIGEVGGCDAVRENIQRSSGGSGHGGGQLRIQRVGVSRQHAVAYFLHSRAGGKICRFRRFEVGVDRRLSGGCIHHSQGERRHQQQRKHGEQQRDAFFSTSICCFHIVTIFPQGLSRLTAPWR